MGDLKKVNDIKEVKDILSKNAQKVKHFFNRESNNTDSRDPKEKSSKSPFERLAHNAQKRVIEMVGGKISVFGSNPDFKEKVKNDLADIDLNTYGGYCAELVREYNEYLKKDRSSIDKVKKQIRENINNLDECEEFFQAIKPSIEKILEVNEPIPSYFNELSFKPENRAKKKLIENAFQNLENQCKQLEKDWTRFLKRSFEEQ